MASGVNAITGSYKGTGALQTIGGEKVGFRPTKVEIHRMETRIDKSEHLEGMADDSFILDKGDDGVRSLVASQGVTLLDDGFSVGTNAAINTADEEYRFVAYK